MSRVKFKTQYLSKINHNFLNDHLRNKPKSCENKRPWGGDP